MILSWDAGLRISAGCFCSSSSWHPIKQNPQTFLTWASHLCHFCMQNPNNRFGHYLKKLLSQYWLFTIFTEKPTFSLETSWNVESDHLRFPCRQNKVWLQLSNRTVRRQDKRGRDIRGYNGIQRHPRYSTGKFMVS